jgi:hypothetical protein
MTQRVRRRWLHQSRIAHRLTHRPLERLIAQVMTPHNARARIARAGH